MKHIITIILCLLVGALIAEAKGEVSALFYVLGVSFYAAFYAVLSGLDGFATRNELAPIQPIKSLTYEQVLSSANKVFGERQLNEILLGKNTGVFEQAHLIGEMTPELQALHDSGFIVMGHVGKKLTYAPTPKLRQYLAPEEVVL